MKVAALILAVAIVGAFAQETTPAPGPPPFTCDGNAFLCKLKELAHNIKYHASKLGGQLKDVGTSVLSSALDHGKNLLANGAQAVLGTLVNHLNTEGLLGKREISFFDKVKTHLSSGFSLLKQFKEGIHAAFKKAVTKLTGVIADNSVLKGVDADADQKIDAAVDEYKKEGHTGFLGMAKAIAGKLKDIFKAGMDTLRERFGKKVEERAIFSSIAAAWAKAKEHLAGLAGTVAETFRPHIETLKKGVAALGAKAKEHGGKLVDAAKASFNALKDKLSGHIDTLKGHAATLGGHATNTIAALKEAISSIAQQAIGNVKGTLGDIVDTGTDAAGVVSGHVADVVSGN